jgi:dTDP-glucose pyrophosphorylase
MIEKYCIEPGVSILDAMKKINDAAIATVAVCEGGKVLGLLTDGDLRRAIIGGASLTDPIAEYYTKKFISVGPDALRADVLELMQARVIEQIPIVDENGALKGIHTMHSILGHGTKPNWAVIMAGGKGTRLGKLTENTPKPMLKVAGRPILERLVLHLVSYGIRHIYLAVNHLSHVIEDYFGDGSTWGCSIEYLREDEPLGSGGALSLLPEQPQHPLILMNGDLLIEADLAQMLMFHEAHDFYATMGVHYYSHEVPFGCLETEQNRIVALEEKPVLTKTINGGVYVLSADAVQNVPNASFFPITSLFEKALSENRSCGAYPLDGDWVDVGLPEQLRQARGTTL